MLDTDNLEYITHIGTVYMLTCNKPFTCLYIYILVVIRNSFIDYTKKPGITFSLLMNEFLITAIIYCI